MYGCRDQRSLLDNAAHNQQRTVIEERQKRTSLTNGGVTQLGRVYRLVMQSKTQNDYSFFCVIEDLVHDRVDDKIAEVSRSLMVKGLATKVISIDYNGGEIARKVIRNNPMSNRRYLDKWETSWHGTKFEYLESIFIHGLVASGERVDDHMITPPANHYQLGEEHFGRSDWAAAIFVSPNLLYASHPCYSDRLMSGGYQWCVLVRARVKPHSYSEHSLLKYGLDGEPESSEYRIPYSIDDKIRRVESSRNVIVTSAVFIRTRFLEQITRTKELTYGCLQSMFQIE